MMVPQDRVVNPQSFIKTENSFLDGMDHKEKAAMKAFMDMTIPNQSVIDWKLPEIKEEESKLVHGSMHEDANQSEQKARAQGAEDLAHDGPTPSIDGLLDGIPLLDSKQKATIGGPEEVKARRLDLLEDSDGKILREAEGEPAVEKKAEEKQPQPENQSFFAKMFGSFWQGPAASKPAAPQSGQRIGNLLLKEEDAANGDKGKMRIGNLLDSKIDDSHQDIKIGKVKGHELDQLSKSLHLNNQRLLRKDSLVAKRGDNLHRQRSLVLSFDLLDDEKDNKIEANGQLQRNQMLIENDLKRQKSIKSKVFSLNAIDAKKAEQKRLEEIS